MIKFQAITGVDDGHLTTKTITFCGDKTGAGVALVPLKLTDSIQPTIKLEVSSATTQSKKGLVSAVVKVTVPYISVTKDANGQLVVDPKRVSYNSYHVVVNLNKYTVEDARGLNGPEAQDLAVKQILGGLGLRQTVSGALLGAPTLSTMYSEGDSVYDYVGPVGMSDSSESRHAVDFGKFTDTGSLDLTSAFGANLVEGPIARILAGLTPIGCEDLKQEAALKERD